MPFHFCIEEWLIIMGAIPIIKHLAHRTHHWYRQTRCQKDDTCIPRCDHPVVKEVYDPLDP